MFILCGAAIVFAMVQCALFFKLAYKRAIELGFTSTDIKKVVKGSAIFSIIPSLPIIISYMILLPALGKYFPWLRLSVIGSATYETMVANMAVTSYGYEGLGTADITVDAYGAIMWVVTFGIMLSGLTVLILKKYDNKMKQISTKKGSFGAMIGPIMFLSMMATFSAPYLIDIKNLVSITTMVVSALSFVLLERLSKKLPVLQEFTFALSMVLGMISASVAANLIGGI